MQFLHNNLLTLLIFLPAAGGVLVLFARGRSAARWTALATTILTFLLSLLLLATFDWKLPGGYTTAPGGVVQMVQRSSWISAFNIEYFIGIDGLSFPLILSSTTVSSPCPSHSNGAPSPSRRSTAGSSVHQPWPIVMAVLRATP